MPKTTTTTTPEPLSVDELEVQAQQAYMAAAQLREEVNAAREQAARERAARIKAYDRAQLAAYDGEAFAADLEAAKGRLSEAILADPVWSAALEVYVTQLRWRHRWTEMQATAQHLGEQFRGGARPDEPNLYADAFVQFVMREGLDRVYAENAERAAAREAAGDEG